MHEKYMKLLMDNRKITRADYDVIRAQDDDVAEVLLFDIIDPWWGVRAQDITRALSALETKNLVIRINSPGGVITEGLAIYNALKRYDGHVICVVDALAASIASVIALAGDETYMVDNGSYMIHNPWGLAVGEADDMRKYAQRLDQDRGRILALYAQKTQLPEEKLSGFLDTESWFTAEEALAQGFIDRIVNPAEDSRASFDLSAFNNAPAVQPVCKKPEKTDSIPADSRPKIEQDKTNIYLQLKAKAQLRLLEEANDLI